MIDTNRVLQDVAWLARRRKPGVRNWLQELCASGFVTLYAPEQLVEEVERHLPDIAESVGVCVEQVRQAWSEYAKDIYFIPLEHAEFAPSACDTRDPTDIPFLAAQRTVGAHGVLSKDKDLAAMGALIVKHEALRFAVDFVRAKSIVVEGTVLGSGTVALGCAVAYGAFKGAVAMVRGYRRLPGWLQVLLPGAVLCGIAVVLFHAPTRARLRVLVERVRPKMVQAREEAGELLGQYLDEMHEADGKAKTALALLREQLPVPRRRASLRQLAYRVCLASKTPLTSAQIENRVRLQGYESKSNSETYLRSVLRKDGRLLETPSGWTVSRRVVATIAPVAAVVSEPRAAVSVAEAKTGTEQLDGIESDPSRAANTR